MKDESFEEKYEMTLFNLEFNILQVARDCPETVDWDVLTAVEALINTTRAEMDGREPDPPELPPMAQQVYGVIENLSRWQIGESQLFGDGEEPLPSPNEPITREELVACLKRIRRSISRWTKRGGRQGYLNYIEQFLPPAPEIEEDAS